MLVLLVSLGRISHYKFFNTSSFSDSNVLNPFCFSHRINEALNLFYTWQVLEGVGSLTYIKR